MIFTLFYFIFHRIRCEILCECLSELQVKVSACNSFVMTFSICYNVSRSDGLVNFFFFGSCFEVYGGMLPHHF